MSTGLATLRTFVSVRCNGSASAVSVTCPVVGLCAYYNTTRRAWATDGCKTLATQGGSTTCQCNHLTDFTGAWRRMSCRTLQNPMCGGCIMGQAAL